MWFSPIVTPLATCATAKPEIALSFATVQGTSAGGWPQRRMIEPWSTEYRLQLTGNLKQAQHGDLSDALSDGPQPDRKTRSAVGSPSCGWTIAGVAAGVEEGDPGCLDRHHRVPAG